MLERARKQSLASFASSFIRRLPGETKKIRELSLSCAPTNSIGWAFFLGPPPMEDTPKSFALEN